MNRRALIAFAAFAAVQTVFAQSEPPHVVAFTPQGLIRGVRQAVATFSEPVVPFGDPRGYVEPFRVECLAKGKARWADPRHWIYDFDSDLPAGEKCSFTLKDGVKTVAGRVIGGTKSFTFMTGGPAVKRSWPYKGQQIAEDQAFILTLDAEADGASVLSHAYFLAEGLGDRIGVRLISGGERESILKNNWDGGGEQQPRLVLQARQTFPSGANVTLVWGAGIATKNGVATDRDQSLVYKVRPQFTAELHCERVNAAEGCLPFSPITLAFSAPVPWNIARKTWMKGPGGQKWSPKAKSKNPRYSEEEGGGDEGAEETGGVFVTFVRFEPPFPAESSFELRVPSGLKDDADRPLSNASRFPLTVETAAYPPLAKFSGQFGILELKGSPILPVTLRNLEPEVKAAMLKLGAQENMQGRLYRAPSSIAPDEILRWLDASFRYSDSWDHSIFASTDSARSFSIPKPNGEKAFEVIGVPLKEPGLYVVEVQSERLGRALFARPSSMYVPTVALVTNLSVHLKRGRESSLVWVTTLDKAESVAGAKIEVADCSGAVLWTGQTDKEGLARIHSKLPELTDCYQLHPRAAAQLVVTARTEDDFSFALDDWSQGIETWRFELPTEGLNPVHAFKTVFDRTLLRAGETVHMKHLARRHAMSGFERPDFLPSKLKIIHEGSEQTWELPLAWDESASAANEWAIPKEAKLGTYRIEMESAAWNEKDSGSFRVEEFRVPLTKAAISPPSEPLVGVSSVTLDFSVRYLAGGGAAGQPVKIRSQTEPWGGQSFEAFEEFVFANGPVEAAGAPVRPHRRRRRSQPSEGALVATLDSVLDRSGAGRASVAAAGKEDAAATLVAELEFRDPNGEAATASTRATLWPSERLVGLKIDGAWFGQDADHVKFHAAVSDIKGRPIAGEAVEVALLQRKWLSHRTRLVGGFYAYDHQEKVVPLKASCSGRTDAKGLVACDVKSPVTGNVILEARVSDAQGRSCVTHTETWVRGSSWFDVGDGDRMDLLPERKRYDPGETARFQARMPYEEARALVTIEREGVLDAFTTTLTRKDPVVSVPVRGGWSPNVFVSVLAVRGRVGSPKETALVDLARPSCRLGAAEIQVGWKARELKVSVRPDREAYHARDTSKVRLSVKTADGAPLPAGAEAAVAAVDEGLLQLMPNGSWKLLEEMMGRRGDSVRTATGQLQVVGRRHFGLKALPQGGGGGRQPTRELFDTLLYWNPRVAIDANGEAEVSVPLNDSITSFRIAAIATAGLDRFGTGEASIRSTQDLMLWSGLAPVVREDDLVFSHFTVRNASERSMDVTLIATGPVSALEPLSVTLPAGESKEIGWQVRVPPGAAKLTYEIEARESGGASDRLKVSQLVKPAVPVRAFQATLAQLDAPFELPVETPKGALPGRGGVQVSVRKSLIGSLEGLINYMTLYPYVCMEQKTSKSIALKDEAMWRHTMEELPSYLDSDGLAKFFPLMIQGSDSLTSYMVSIADEAGWVIPASSKERMLTGLRGFIEGRVIRGSPLPTADLSIRKLSALEALARAGRADSKLLASISIEPNLWPTSAVLTWVNLLERLDVPERAARRAEAEQVLRSRLNFQGTTMGFSTETSDGLWWLMVSNDLNSVRLLLAELGSADWKEDMPRLARGALQRQHRGHWDITPANAWGRLALDKFAAAFENSPVEGTTDAALGGSPVRFDWSADSDGGSKLLPWPGSVEPLKVRHNGSGRPWLTVTSLAAIPLKEPLSTGYKVTKTVTPVERKSPNAWSRGDIVRVRLDVEAQADMTWVVVDDPIPAGASVLGTGLGRDSGLLTKGEERKGWVWPAFEERSFEAFRSYYEWVPKGTFTVDYTMRLNNEGLFHQPTTRVEAMYAPEMFAELPNEDVEVRP